MESINTIFDYQAFAGTELKTDPFDHIVVPAFIKREALKAINDDYPELPGPGTFPVETCQGGARFTDLWEAVNSAQFRDWIADKFDMDLRETAVMGTIRRECEPTDGAIHTDSKTKLITILFYFNEEWPHEGGRLRLLRSETDLEDFADEVVPENGTMLAFRVCKHSYHGHKPFTGDRRIMQLHFVDPKRIEKNKMKRRTLRWRIKKLLHLG